MEASWTVFDEGPNDDKQNESRTEVSEICLIER